MLVPCLLGAQSESKSTHMGAVGGAQSLRLPCYISVGVHRHADSRGRPWSMVLVVYGFASQVRTPMISRAAASRAHFDVQAKLHRLLIATKRLEFWISSKSCKHIAHPPASYRCMHSSLSGRGSIHRSQRTQGTSMPDGSAADVPELLARYHALLIAHICDAHQLKRDNKHCLISRCVHVAAAIAAICQSTQVDAISASASRQESSSIADCIDG
jgi:hypothetical protein